jgi:arabinose-5-phosphate isomerase
VSERDGVLTAAPAAAESVLSMARRVLRLEAAAIAEAEARLGDAFVAAVERLRDARGRVIVSGLGKSGIIARKIAATLTSTGTPATFLHPVEGLHGDLGHVGRDDSAILLSKSGESAELAALIAHLARFGVPIIALTGRPASTLGRAAVAVLDCSVREEACPYDLAPTTSSTVALAMGDALAVALLHERGFTRDDFARLHPGGAIGRRLTLRVADVMVHDDLPCLGPDAVMRECIVLLAEKRGTVAIVDGERRLLGVVTAGDLTRLMEREQEVFGVRVGDVMTRAPKRIEPDALAAAAVFLMETHGVMALPVVDAGGHVLGMVHLHDLLRASVV